MIMTRSLNWSVLVLLVMVDSRLNEARLSCRETEEKPLKSLGNRLGGHETIFRKATVLLGTYGGSGIGQTMGLFGIW